MSRLAIGILGSGKGSNCRAILEQIRARKLAADARLIVSDVFDAGILDIAREFGVPNAYLPPGRFRTRFEPAVEMELVKMLEAAGVDLVVLAGFMRVLKEPMLNAFPRRIINVHPSLLPKFPGMEAWSQALAAGEKFTGCTVHYGNCLRDRSRLPEPRPCHGSSSGVDRVRLRERAGSHHHANTLPQHNASTRVLLKCGFTLIGEVTHSEDGIVWRWEMTRQKT